VLHRILLGVYGVLQCIHEGGFINFLFLILKIFLINIFYLKDVISIEN
jgi:hypothetical protein